MPGTQILLEGGNTLTESTKIYTDLKANAAGSAEAAAALLSLAGVAFGLVGKIEAPFTQALAAGVGVNAGALGVVIAGIQLGTAIDEYRDAMAGYDGDAQQAAYENLADKTCGVVAGIGGTIAAIPGLQLLGLGIWLGASLAQQYTNGNFGRLYDFLKWNVFNIDNATNANFLDARNLVVRRDPLVLDLDGDGIELIGANGAILFDHNADNIKTGTGWANPDDGFLVRDLNGNGTIDTGRELFGVDTIKSNDTLATQGFDALSDLDSNADGQITSADAAYGELKVWQDANQDGISQSTELTTLAEQGITRIGLNGTSSGPQAGQIINNNRVALSTTFTRNDQARTVGAIDLETNNFFTEFPPQVVDQTGNPVTITEQAQGLPEMNGSGMVRNMRAAASLDSDFATALATFAATSTREGQRADIYLGDISSKRRRCVTVKPDRLRVYSLPRMQRAPL